MAHAAVCGRGNIHDKFFLREGGVLSGPSPRSLPPVLSAESRPFDIRYKFCSRNLIFNSNLLFPP